MSTSYVDYPIKTKPCPARQRIKDPVKRNIYYAFIRHKCQANWRNEEYLLTANDWFDFWPPEVFEQRGRGADNLVLCRQDQDGPWSKDNCIVTTRQDFLVNIRNVELRRS